MKRLYKNWPTHNCIGHPFMEVCHWFGLMKLGRTVHDATLPE